jgi:hypothetical protein
MSGHRVLPVCFVRTAANRFKEPSYEDSNDPFIPEIDVRRQITSVIDVTNEVQCIPLHGTISLAFDIKCETMRNTAETFHEM